MFPQKTLKTPLSTSSSLNQPNSKKMVGKKKQALPGL
jgi:hypothetical protein